MKTLRKADVKKGSLNCSEYVSVDINDFSNMFLDAHEKK